MKMLNMGEKIKEWMAKDLNLDGDFSVEHPQEIDRGDYASNVAFIEAKKQNKNPKDIAKEFAEILEKNKLEQIEKIEVAGAGFVNFFLKKGFFSEAVASTIPLGNASGENKNLEGQKIIIEFTDPNPFKEFHIGHLMSNTIGESISRLISTSGAEVRRACYQGDVGLHVAKAVWFLMKENKSDIKSAKELGEAYAKGDKAYKEDEQAKQEIIELNGWIFNHENEKVDNIYYNGRKISLDYFESIYKRLGTKFDFYFFESKTGEYGKKIVEENTPNIFEQSEGAIVYKGEKVDPKLHTRVFINREGLPTYEAKELGLAKIKYDTYSYDTSIVVTANEINEYFKVLLSAMSKVFPELASKTKHLSHGMLRLPSGKMSSRKGNVITAESLIDDVKKRILEKMADPTSLEASSRRRQEMTEDKKQEVAEIVSIGAIKYSILHQSIGTDIIFDFEKSLSFEGDSGPYLQYAFVRAQSVLEKANISNLVSRMSIPDDWITTHLERMIARFPEVVERSAKEYAPHHIAKYLIELAGAFNNFYAGHKIIDPTDATSGYKLSLTESFANVIKKGLDLLGIKVPDQM